MTNQTIKCCYMLLVKVHVNLLKMTFHELGEQANAPTSSKGELELSKMKSFAQEHSAQPSLGIELMI